MGREAGTAGGTLVPDNITSEPKVETEEDLKPSRHTTAFKHPQPGLDYTAKELVLVRLSDISISHFSTGKVQLVLNDITK